MLLISLQWLYITKQNTNNLKNKKNLNSNNALFSYSSHTTKNTSNLAFNIGNKNTHISVHKNYQQTKIDLITYMNLPSTFFMFNKRFFLLVNGYIGFS